MEPTPEPSAAVVYRAATDALWRMGHLLWKCGRHEDQKAVYALMLTALAAGAARFVLEIARRWGKTWLLCIVAMETCLRKPGCRVVYGAPTLKDLQEFIIPTIEAICRDAPEDCRPVFNAATMHFTFPKHGPAKGSYIHLFGCDDRRKANRGRGSGAALVILDECGFIPILLYVIRSVLRPQLLHSGGAMLLGSTPPEEPDHDFTEIASRAEANGNYARRTIYDNPLLTEAQVQSFIEADAKDEGLTAEEYVKTDTFRREYLAERVLNPILVVMGEDWERRRVASLEGGRLAVRPEFFNGMTVLDPGGNDPHGVQFSYWDFKAAKWVIEDELLLKKGENTEVVTREVRAKEKALWGVELYTGTLRAAREDPSQELLRAVPDWMQDILYKDAPTQPFARWSDTNIQMIRDLYELHKMAFLPTAKDDLQWAVNNLRVLAASGDIWMHPRCAHSDRHWGGTTWKDHKRKEFARRGGEHGDLLATGIYGARNLDRRNPYPKDWFQVAPINPVAGAVAAQKNDDVARAFLGTGPLARKLMGIKRR